MFVEPNYNNVPKTSNRTRTRGLKGQNIAIETCTEFTLHISQQAHLARKCKNLIDYSQHRLERYIDAVDDAQQKMVLYALLSDYNKGEVALAWKSGRPVYIQVTKA